MPLHDLPLTLILRQLDGGLHVGEALHFPELLALHAKPERLRGMLRNLAKQILAEAPPLEIHRRLPAAAPALTRVSVSLAPPKASAAWTEPITLRFDVFRWRHGDEASIAYVPALGIQVVAQREDALDELIARHVRVALARTKAAERLFDLVQLARVDSVSVVEETVAPNVRTPAQIAADGAKDDEPGKPVIEDVGTVLSDAIVSAAYEVDALIARLADALVGQNPKSVLLVGPSGVGKTAAFGELFRRRGGHRLSATPFWMTSGSRLIAGMSGFGLWQARCQRLCKEAKRDGAILHLGNLVELMEVGKTGGGGLGIASFFRPYLARGEVLAVVECTPEQLPLIERANPHLLGTFQTIGMIEPESGVMRRILALAAVEEAGNEGRWSSEGSFRADKNVRPTKRSDASAITGDAIDTIDRLHRRYATYSASPGRPLRFLRNLLHDRGAKGAINTGDVTAAFSRETGLPLFLLDDATPLDLAAARQHFAARVIGQPEAVDLVTDLLATVKAALNRPGRPIASLLFIGPTGIGKTEMAKALADYFFGAAGAGAKTRMEDSGWKMEEDAEPDDPPPSAIRHSPSSLSDPPPSSILHPPSSSSSNTLRFDMSEYASPAAVARLVGGAWESEGLLTAKVREQPFCVLLFDEFEKADPSFFDLLLQVLGEGRLTDAAGRLADFSNAIVVMTSNLGAEGFGSGPFGLARATTGPADHAKGHFTDAVRDFLRPELFNRIDRVVPFLPLGPDAIARIAAREIEQIRRRDGMRGRGGQDVRLEVSETAIAHLAKSGYDPRYGARPLKRRIEQDLLAPLADAVNQYAPSTALVARVDMTDGRLSVEVRALVTDGEVGSWGGGVQGSSHSVTAASTVRRRLQALRRSPAALALQNELFTLDRLDPRKQAHPARRFIEPAQRERQKRLRTVAEEIDRLTAEATALEDALLLQRYEPGSDPLDADAVRTRLAHLWAFADELLLLLFTLDQPDPHSVIVGLYGNAPAELFSLATAYRRAAEARMEGGGSKVDDEDRAAEAALPGFFPSSIINPPSSLSLSYYTRFGKHQLQRTSVDPDETDAFLANPRGVIGLVLSIRAPFARARFESESGLHVVEEERNRNPHPILVDASSLPAADYRPPKDVEFRVALAGQRRRTYTLDRREAADPVTGETYRWSGRDSFQALAAAIDDYLRKRAEVTIDADQPW